MMPCPGSITVRRKPIARRFDVPGEPSLGRYRLGGVGRLRKLRRARVSSLSNTIELGRDPAVADGVGFRPAFPQFFKLAISITNRYFTSPFSTLS